MIALDYEENQDRHGKDRLGEHIFYTGQGKTFLISEV